MRITTDLVFAAKGVAVAFVVVVGVVFDLPCNLLPVTCPLHNYPITKLPTTQSEKALPPAIVTEHRFHAVQ